MRPLLRLTARMYKRYLFTFKVARKDTGLVLWGSCSVPLIDYFPDGVDSESTSPEPILPRSEVIRHARRIAGLT